MAEPSLTWPGGARLAMSFVVNVEEGSEMSVKEGDKGPEPVDELQVSLRIPIRNYVNESNYRYGLEAGAPRIMALLEREGIRATFTAAALSLERERALTERIVAGGHEIACHGWRWIHQFSFPEEKERDFIRKGAETIERVAGARPRGWLSRYLHTPATRRLLLEEGFVYHMDDLSRDWPFWEAVDGADRPMVVTPYALDTNDMKFWLDPSLTPDDWADYAIATFDRLYAEGAAAPRMMSLGLHLRIIGRPGRIGALERVVAHVKAHRDVWIATRLEIAEHFAGAVPAEGAAVDPAP